MSQSLPDYTLLDQKKGFVMKIGIIGLGKMGANMTRRMLRGGHEVVAFDPNESARKEAGDDGAIVAGSIGELVDKLRSARLFG